METKEEKFRKNVNEYREKIMYLCGYYSSIPEDQKDMCQEILSIYRKVLIHSVVKPKSESGFTELLLILL
jgi:hypothetical protein